MLERPAFRPYFNVAPVPGEGTFLLSENAHFVLFGGVTEHVAGAIDGRRTADEIADVLSGCAGMQDVYLTLATLERDGYLTEGDPAAPRDEAAFWATLGTSWRAARDRLDARAVAVHCLDRTATDVAVAALGSLGVSTASDADASLVVTDDYLRPELDEIDRDHREAGRPWILAKPQGSRAWVGPLFVPGRTACWHCLADRLRENREVEAFIESKRGTAPPPTATAALASTRRLAVELAALQLCVLLGAGQSPLSSRIVTLNWHGLEQHNHAVARRPQCPACGDPGLARNSDDVPLPKPTGRAEIADGGLRTVDAEVTYRRFEHLVSPISGVVRAIVPIVDAAEAPFYVYGAGHNFALKSDSLYFLQDGLRTNSAGKGTTAAQARASALCEAVERWSGVYRGDEERIRARFVDLGSQAIHPNRCMLFSDRQYRERAAWLARGSRFQVVPRPFDDEAEVEWTPARSLVDGQSKLLPTGLLYFGYPLADEEFFYWADSNGNAAGNTMEEAMLQGFLELVERDAVCVWWYNRLSRPVFDLASLGDPYVDRLLAYYRARGRAVWALDVTNDLGIPAFAAVSRRTDRHVEDIVIGFGAHLDARTAVMRAIAELNQFMPAVHNRLPGGDTAYAYDDRDALRWWRSATLANQPYLAPLPVRARRIEDYPALSSGDAGEDLIRCVGTVAALGHETLVLNQTRPDIGLPVVKVIVPGLRHFWARFAPGRLYDVPVRLGWLPEALDESMLNPIPMFV